jgi:gamma-glutamylcyclotransferase (GGCT)/AIG2-like uncharacterized protein YtfP
MTSQTSHSVHLPFFVYGTLLPGQPNHALWRDAIHSFRPALLLRARLYDLGCYPMLVDAPAGEVRGLAVTIRPSSYAAAVALLDQLEGIGSTLPGSPHYRRTRRVVRLADGQSTVAWVYVGTHASVAGLKPIGPDWKAHVRGQTQVIGN